MQDFESKLPWSIFSFILHLLNHSFSLLINRYILRAALSAIGDIKKSGQPPFKWKNYKPHHTHTQQGHI